MIDKIGGIIFIILGVIFAIFYRQVAKNTVAFYYRLLHVYFSEKGYQIGFIITGIVFIIFGILFVFGVIKSK